MKNLSINKGYGVYEQVLERIKRIGKARGFGIQSPWAFSFVTEIIGEKWPYYDYVRIEQEYNDKNEQKFQKLMLRLRNFVYPSNVTIIDLSNDITEQDLTTIAKEMDKKGALVIRSIYKDNQSLYQWHLLQDNDNVGITFDLYSFGICFFDRNIIKQHYKLNF